MDELLDLIQSSVDLEEPIDENSPLISSGLIDSFDMVTLITAIEDRYGLQIPVERISIEAFDTPRLMQSWLEGAACDP